MGPGGPPKWIKTRLMSTRKTGGLLAGRPAGYNIGLGFDMHNSLLTKVINKNKRTDTPEFRPGDTIRVHVKIKEGDKERLQAFEGTVIARNNTGMGESITVRKVSFGQGVERIFPVHARVIDHIDVVRTGRVRRAKLYYLRGLKGKAARLRERE
jgi:large subunit ribosomal protein L19